MVGCGECFDSDMWVWLFLKIGVKNCIGYVIVDFIGMFFGYIFIGEKKIVCFYGIDFMFNLKIVCFFVC